MKTKIGKGDIIDWLFPAIVGVLVAVVAMSLSDFHGDMSGIIAFAETLLTLLFTYATTTLGLSLTCYALFQTLDNEMVRKVRSWTVYRRFKEYMLHIIELLAVLAVLCLLELFIFERLLWKVSIWILLGVPVFLTVLTLSALVYWIRLLVIHFDSEK